MVLWLYRSTCYNCIVRYRKDCQYCTGVFNISSRYTKYIPGANILNDIHTLPVRFKTHAALALLERSQLNLEDVRHYLKTAKIIRPLEKDGCIGILQSNIGDTGIRFVCLVREKTLWIITVGECK